MISPSFELENNLGYFLNSSYDTIKCDKNELTNKFSDQMFVCLFYQCMKDVFIPTYVCVATCVLLHV